MNNKINKIMTKKISIVLLSILLLFSCWQQNNNTEIKNHKLTSFNKDEVKNDIKNLDKEGERMVIDFFSSKDEKKKKEIKDNIEKHMIDIQSGISNIKWETIEEKNKEIQKITKKIKLYKKLGF